MLLNSLVHYDTLEQSVYTAIIYLNISLILFQQFQGIWYEIARYPNIGEDSSRGKCSTAEYTMKSADKGRVKNSHVVNGVNSYIEGDLTLLEPGKIMITYTFGGEYKFFFYIAIHSSMSCSIFNHV